MTLPLEPTPDEDEGSGGSAQLSSSHFEPKNVSNNGNEGPRGNIILALLAVNTILLIIVIGLLIVMLNQ